MKDMVEAGPPTADQVINDRAPRSSRSRPLFGLAAGAVSAVALSLFFPYPLLPVLVGIAFAGRLGKSTKWGHGLLYGVVIGPSGFVVRIFIYRPDLGPELWEKGVALIVIAAVFGFVGVGVNKLVTGRGSVLW